NVAFATLGDAMTYSTFGYVYKIIKEKHPDISIEIIPGINSFTTLSAISQKVLAENRQTLHVVPSVKDADIEKIEFPENSTTILLKTYRTRETLLKRLQKEKEKHPGLEIIYGEHLGLESERLAFSLEEIKTIPETYLSMIMVKK
ncbi:MAG: precorrin-2 C(20)-methyltransferase, partial [Mailhella sp.]